MLFLAQSSYVIREEYGRRPGFLLGRFFVPEIAPLLGVDRNAQLDEVDFWGDLSGHLLPGPGQSRRRIRRFQLERVVPLMSTTVTHRDLVVHARIYRPSGRGPMLPRMSIMTARSTPMATGAR